MNTFNPQPATRNQHPETRGQLNVDIGTSRRTRLRDYCREKKISIVECVKQMIDFCIGEYEDE